MTRTVMTKEYLDRIYDPKHIPTDDDVEVLSKADAEQSKMQQTILAEQRKAREVIAASIDYKKVSTRIEELSHLILVEKKRQLEYDEKVKSDFMTKQDGQYAYPRYSASKRNIKSNVVAVLRKNTKFGYLTHSDIEHFTNALIAKKTASTHAFKNRAHEYSTEQNELRMEQNKMTRTPRLDYQAEVVSRTRNALQGISRTVRGARLENRPLTKDEVRSIERRRIECSEFIDNVYDDVILMSPAAEL